MKTWSDPEWEQFTDAMPREQHVMRIAQRWSICPLDIDNDTVTSLGIYGFPPGIKPR